MPLPPPRPEPPPPRVDRDSPPRPPLGASPKRRQGSHDDLGTVAELEAAEGRARAALAEAERSRAAEREQAIRAAQAEAERDRLSVVTAPTPVTKSEAPPDSKVARFRGKGWSIAIPAGFLLALAPLVTPVVQHFVSLEREIAAMRVAFTGQQERFTALEQTMVAQAKEAAELRSTVARLSGYLEGALGAAGVKVKAEPGATAVDVQTEGPAPAARRQQVRLATPVPAPKAR